MKLGRLVWVTLVCGLFALPVPCVRTGSDVVQGNVRDNTGAVLPGVTVTATHEASGTTFVGVTDERGVFASAVRAGVYRITVELAGFATVAARASSCWSAGRHAEPRDGASPACRSPSPSPAKHRSSTRPRRTSAATSTRGRCRNCR